MGKKGFGLFTPTFFCQFNTPITVKIAAVMSKTASIFSSSQHLNTKTKKQKPKFKKQAIFS